MTSSISSSNDIYIAKKRKRNDSVIVERQNRVERVKRRRAGAESCSKDIGDMCLIFNIQAVKLLIQFFYEMVIEKREAGYRLKIKFEVKDWETLTTKFNDRLKEMGACKDDFTFGQLRSKISEMKVGKCSDLKTIIVTDPELWTKWELYRGSTEFSRASSSTVPSPEIAPQMGIDKDAEKMLKRFKLPGHVGLAGYQLFNEHPTIIQMLNIVPAKERKGVFYMRLAQVHMEEMQFDDNATRVKALNLVSNPNEAEAFMRCYFISERREYIIKRLSELYPSSALSSLHS